MTRLMLGLSVALVLLPACSGAVPQRPSTIMFWALGSSTLGDSANNLDARLALVPAGKPLDQGTPITGCLGGVTEVLPAPPPDTRLFLLRNGRVHVLQPGGKTEPLPGAKSIPTFTYLLAFRAETSPLQMLVARQLEDGSDWQLFTLTLGKVIVAEPIQPDRTFASQEAFFEAYHAPRCLPGGQHCLVQGDDGQQKYIEVEHTRGGPKERPQPVGQADVRDMAWAPDQKSMYVVVGCPKQPSTAATPSG